MQQKQLLRMNQLSLVLLPQCEVIRGLQVETFKRFKEETDRDQQLIKLREFLSSDDGTGGMPEGLKITKDTGTDFHSLMDV